MMTFDEIEARIEAIVDAAQTAASPAAELLRLGERVLENWIVARGEIPTLDTREGFRLLALHRQGAKGEPSFNACRETCRELVYHYNLLVGSSDLTDARGQTQGSDPDRILRMMGLVAKHLCLFVAGKMQTEGLGTFCCAAKPVRASQEAGDGPDLRLPG